MTVALQALPQFFDNSGNPLSNGKLFTYQAGTLTPLASYTDRGGSVPNANPVLPDAAGRASVWLSTNVAYKLILQDSGGVQIQTVDNFYAGADPAQLAAAGIVPSTGGAYTGAVSFEGGATFSGTAAQDLATLDSLNIASVQVANLWTNPDFSVNQRNATTAADAAYGFDRTVNLCETGSITLSQLAQPADGIPFAMRQLQPDATPKRFGFLQIVEARDCVAYRGKNLALALKVRCSEATTVRCALVAWTGTQDAPTRDIVNNWASTNYTAGNFFVANTSTIAVAATPVTAATWTDVLVSSASPGGVQVPSGMNNLYMVVWTDLAQAQNVTLDASIVRCGQGTVAPLWTPINAAIEEVRCKRYFQTVYTGIRQQAINAGQAMSQGINFPVVMRATPTIANFLAGTAVNATGTQLNANTRGFQYDIIASATGDSFVLNWVYSATAELGV